MRRAIKKEIRQTAVKLLENLEFYQTIPKVSKQELEEEIQRMKMLLLGEKRSFGARLISKEVDS